MTVEDLRRLLEGVDDDVEVRLACQPAWPFEYTVGEALLVNVVEQYELLKDEDGWYIADHSGEDISEIDQRWPTVEEAQEALERLGDGHEPVFLIAEGQQDGYLKGANRLALGW